MRVAIVHNAVNSDSAPDDADVLVQVEAVREALDAIGHEWAILECSLDLASVKHRLEKFGADIVFNLVESLGCQGRLSHLFTFLLDAMAMPYTGSSSRALLTTNHKVMAKEIMTNSGLQTPSWIGPFPQEASVAGFEQVRPTDAAGDMPLIIKSVWEHASFGIDENGLLTGKSVSAIEDMLMQKASGLGGACFAEVFVDGREFNISLLAGPHGPIVLPPAEITFDDFAPGKLRIVGYRAKWEENSFEYNHTSRRFDFPRGDDALLGRLKADAVACWDLFRLCGYARIDFRVDGRGGPWILEVNSNPCLSPDAGFVAAVRRAGLTFQGAVEFILADANRSLPIYKNSSRQTRMV